jgi:outer membrane protein assembly factor BamB
MRRAALLASGLALALAACGSGSAAPASTGGSPPPATAAAVPSGDWPMFDFNPQRTGVGPAHTGITAGNLRTLRARRVQLDGTVDASPIELHGVTVSGRRRDVIVVTTSYGRTIAIDAATGHRLWEFVPPGIRRLEGSAQITTATPVADPGRRYVYAASPDGLIRKLSLATGGQVRSGGWPVRVTNDPTREKIPSALNLSGRELIVTTGGYVGDTPSYQGHVVTIDRTGGRILHVWNSLCADAHRLIVPRTCPASDSAIWGRAGAVVEPGTGRLLVATGNADFSKRSPFDGRRFWPDSVLELTPDAATLLHNWTPRNQEQLSDTDTDLGSTAPALLGSYAGRRLAVQGGKDGLLHLLDLGRLDGTTGPASARTGGELQNISTPGGAQLLSAPAVWVHGGLTRVFVADSGGTAIYELTGGASPRLRRAAANGTPGTSPVLAGGLLYVYNQLDGTLEVYDPSTLHRLVSLPAAVGHWNSPIVVGGRIIVPEGDDNEHSTHGTLDIFHLPGR